MTQGLLERDSMSVGAGRWASITKEFYRDSGIEHAVAVPVLQSLALSLSVGASAAAVTALFAQDWQTCLSVCGLVVPLTFTFCLVDGFKWARSALQSLELWESESGEAGSVDHATVKVELVERGSSAPYGRIVYEELSCSHDDLAMVARADRLSKRGLMEAGFSDSVAMSILGDLLRYGYIAREADNRPACWTSKGEALKRAFSGGGGGGGGQNHQ